MRGPRGSFSWRTGLNARAFTLIDVLVTSAVMAVLIGILIPSLSGAQENARRTVCRSNVRQIGLGMVMFADDHNGRLPSSSFVRNINARGSAVGDFQNMLMLRRQGQPDGIGQLYDTYLSSGKIFYCPSHRGNFTYSSIADKWDSEDDISGNYQYRGVGPTSRTDNPEDQRFTPFLYDIDPACSSLLADSMRESADYNHRDGLNYFRADLTTQWFSDYENQLTEYLADNQGEAKSSDTNNAWRLIDGASEPK